MRRYRCAGCGHVWRQGTTKAWNTANDAVLAEGRRALINDKHRFDGGKVIGVDEHV